MVKLLLATGKVDINVKENVGRTPLSNAAMRGHETVATLLLSHDSVDPDQEDHYGSTPLSIAVRNSRTEVVKILLATRRVALDSQDRFGRTPWWWARKCGNNDIEQALRDYAERNGILVCDNNESSEVGLTPNNQTSSWCDICTLGISEDEIFYICGICNGGDFYVCLECCNIGGQCLMEHHQLARGGDKE
ncbi:hypothetical protein FOPG_19875 [Fusarium oxysporum f. sp. conglutinans race 2 54008]|uniref:Uncharacterized protein n=1 Tax=Fusarium oxysporum f. sp. conglutinans race 2 54008 TaxID=1089457 RepID=X0GKM9_FUSOX|nr:hypothetical protein FOPG_19875 [Fusarium oxysporum f. sp. conglutinans race 2 54008]